MSEVVPAGFEAKLARIEEIVKRLEGGQVLLDEAVKLFGEGKALSDQCVAQLKDAQEQLDKAASDDAK
jgi:exodeoxyribonuclease VII small subunit